MIKAIIFDFYGVLNEEMNPNQRLLAYIKTALKPKYKLGIISNAVDDFMYQIVEEAMLREIFDGIVVSHQVGVAKPEAAVYQKSLQNLGVRAEEAVFIDDTEVFCQAARAVGMKAIYYQNFEQMKKELENLLNGAGSNN
ncbi:MAG: HAD-IA family hydrolase [Candidatus Saccharimonadales bacterium]